MSDASGYELGETVWYIPIEGDSRVYHGVVVEPVLDGYVVEIYDPHAPSITFRFVTSEELVRTQKTLTIYRDGLPDYPGFKRAPSNAGY